MKTWILLNKAKTKEAALSSYNLQSSRSVKWQESGKSRSSHQNLRVEKHELLTSF